LNAACNPFHWNDFSTGKELWNGPRPGTDLQHSTFRRGKTRRAKAARRRKLRKELLPAISAIATVSAAISTTIAAASTAAASATTTTAMAATAAAVAAATTSATTAAALCLRPRFVHHQVASPEVLSVHRVDRAIRFFVICNFNESESARLPGKTVANQIHCRRIYTALREKFVQAILRRGKRKITNIELLHLPTPSARNPLASRGAR
jgi:hypothetical protein